MDVNGIGGSEPILVPAVPPPEPRAPAERSEEPPPAAPEDSGKTLDLYA